MYSGQKIFRDIACFLTADLLGFPPALRFSEKLISDRIKEEFILKVVNLNKFWNF